ncbi:hypothetical protein CR513_24278, partial [Mucuna pruriens]
MCVAATGVVNVSAQINSILMLNMTNFKVWKEVVEIVLNCMDLYSVLRIEEPIPTMNNLQENKKRKNIKGDAKGSSKGKKPKKNEEFTCFFSKNSHKEILQIGSRGTKRKLIENSVILWHKRLGHISKRRIQRLVLDEILEALDLSNFKSFKAEVQLGKKIKAIKYDHGGEYYGRYDGLGEQRLGPFALFLRECGIVPQYTMSGKLSKNGVTERRNQTLKDMVRTGNVRILEEVEFEKEKNIRNVIFEEESINDIGQVLVPITIQETTLVIGDNVHNIIHNIVPEQKYDEMDVKTTFLNDDIDETIYTVQLENFVSNESKSMTLIAPSTMAAEFVACFETSNHGIWLWNFVTNLWMVDGIERPLKIYCDNNLTILYSNNNKSSTKLKYIDIKFLK